MKNGQVLKNELKNLGLTFRSVSEKAGIPYQSLYNYLSGRSPIPQDRLLKVAQVYQLDLKKFLLSD